MHFLTEEELDLLEPTPDIHVLFVYYNELYFEGKLGACSVEWSSSRMTSCGGTCELVGGGAGGARIKLSEPLLKLRPSRDLKEVLLHEMTHAYMMLQGIRDDDRGGHGTIFKSIIQRINTSRLPDHQRPPGGYNVSVYHTMLAEVDHYRQHHWKCERCGNLVKRAMNRPPQEADCRGRMGRGAGCHDPECRFHMHQKHCGGTWVKVKEPEGYQNRAKKQGGSSSTVDNSSRASNAWRGTTGTGAATNGARPDDAQLPAKRPRKGSRSLPASAAAGTRSITEFFGQGGPSGKQPGAGLGGADVLPALKAVPGAAPAAASVGARTGQQSAFQQQQQRTAQQAQQAQEQLQPAEPSAAGRRRLLAEAALRRLAGSAGENLQRDCAQQEQQVQQLVQQQGQQQEQQQQQQEQQQGQQQVQQQQQEQRQEQRQQQEQQQGQQQGQQAPASAQECPEVINLLDSPPDAAPSWRQQAGASQRQLVDASNRLASPAEWTSAGASKAASHGGGPGTAGGCLECPVCGRQWEAAAISNAELNAHIDECLNASFF